MFSFPRLGCIQTGTSGYAYIFDSQSGESYVFLRNLGGGAQSNVQLVANIFTGEVVVQKVSKLKMPIKDAYTEHEVPEDGEVRILEHLNSLIHNPVHPITPLTPRWTTCVSHEDIPIMSRGARPKLECMRVSYWKLCNAGTLSDWLQTWRNCEVSGMAADSSFPVSIIARCVSQVSETLHIMYQAGPEAVYHCDLHLANIFLHFDPNNDNRSLPDFYIGDFGWSRTASEAELDGRAMYSSGTSVLNNRGQAHPGFQFPSAPPGTAPPGQRRRWDVARLGQGLESFLEMAVPGTSEQAGGLLRLMMKMKSLDSQDQELAANSPRSRPPSLIELAHEAKKLERAAMAVEEDTEQFREFIALRRAQAEQIMKSERPYVSTSGLNLAPEVCKARAVNYGNANIHGRWTLIESV